MKKVISIVLMLTFVLPLFACGGAVENEVAPTDEGILEEATSENEEPLFEQLVTEMKKLYPYAGNARALDDSYLEIDTSPFADFSKAKETFAGTDYIEKTEADSLCGIKFINEKLGFSDGLFTKMLETTMLMGTQVEENNDFRVSWTYNPEDGLIVRYEKKAAVSATEKDIPNGNEVGPTESASEKTALEKAIDGKWMHYYTMNLDSGGQVMVVNYYVFDDGKAHGGTEVIDITSKENYAKTNCTGTYEITDTTIMITWDETTMENEDFPIVPYDDIPYLYLDEMLHLMMPDGKGEFVRQGE